MQVLYAMNRDKALTSAKAMSHYKTNVNQAYNLYLFNLHHLIKVAEYSKVVQQKKKEKLRPSQEDLNFKPILSTNELIESLKQNESLNREFRIYKTSEKILEDNVRLIYKIISKTEEYTAYLAKESRDIEDHRQMLMVIFKAMIANEVFLDVLDEKYLFWEDDKSLVVGAMKKTLKSLPNENAVFYEAYRPTKETVAEFGEVLMNKVHSNGQELFELIEPTLKNWDAERVAVIDMILLKMAVCELINFPTIPTKVTLNEFVEISKLYSTDKSKDFINGILDRLLKKLEKEGKVTKEGRGLIQ